MSTNIVTDKHTHAFASKAQGIFMSSSVLGDALSFLELKNLCEAETVCRNWHKCIEFTHQWKKQCQNILGLPSDAEPKKYLPEGFSYKKSIEIISPRLLGRSFWQRYIGDVGRVSPIPKSISFAKWNEPDPCDPTTTIGKEYVWMYCPSHIVSVPKAGSTVREVPVTINNIGELFKRLKTGHPSQYSYIWDKIVEQHGNKTIPAEWICMRRSLIGRGLEFVQQQALAKEKGIDIAQLLHRIVFNFLEHARSNVYPDGQAPLTYARTSTLTRDAQGRDWPSGCGAGDPSGLNGDCYVGVHHGDVGVGVALPAEVQAIGS